MSEITIYGTSWCSDCQRSKRFFANHGIDVTFIDLETDAEAEDYVRSLQHGERRVPTILFPDDSILIEPSHQELGRKLDIIPAARADEYDVVIVGGGPAGLVAALYSGRQSLTTLTIDADSFGGQAVTTQRIDNYPGFPEGIGGGRLAETFLAHAESPTTEFLSATQVLRLSETEDAKIHLDLSNGQRIRARSVILATGTTYRILGVPGEQELLGRRIHFCSTCDGPTYKGREKLVIVGGGNSACEEALYLATLVNEVIMLQNLPDLTADAVLRRRIETHPQISVVTRTAVTEFSPHGSGVSVTFRRGDDPEESQVTADGAFEFIGLTANSSPFAQDLRTDPQGYVLTDSRYATSMPNVYAAGDVRSGSTKQLAAAAGEAVGCFVNVRDALQTNAGLVAQKAG